MASRASLTPCRITPWNRIARALWSACWLVLYRPSPTPFHGWRRWLLRLFGARIGKGAHPYPSARIWAPWNLEMHESSCLASHVDCYCVARVTIGRGATVSQYSYLCTASHDYHMPSMALIAAPIVIENNAWVTAGAYVGPGVSVGEGAVVGARAVVVKNVPAWTIVAGNPARAIGNRNPF